MDVFAHGLWGGAAGAAANRKLGTRLRFLTPVFWGMFPDLFAFVPVALVGLWSVGLGQLVHFHVLFSHALRDRLPSFLWPEALYKYSHGLPVFVLVFAVVWLAWRRPPLEMLAWPLHILMDIPTHESGAWRTPFLWPFSDYRFSGIWWSRPWVMALNYSLLTAAYIALFVWKRPSRSPAKSAGRQR
jgi:uncharacterized membrane protein YhhN